MKQKWSDCWNQYHRGKFKSTSVWISITSGHCPLNKSVNFFWFSHLIRWSAAPVALRRYDISCWRTRMSYAELGARTQDSENHQQSDLGSITLWKYEAYKLLRIYFSSFIYLSFFNNFNETLKAKTRIVFCGVARVQSSREHWWRVSPSPTIEWMKCVRGGGSNKGHCGDCTLHHNKEVTLDDKKTSKISII